MNINFASMGRAQYSVTIYDNGRTTRKRTRSRVKMKKRGKDVQWIGKQNRGRGKRPISRNVSGEIIIMDHVVIHGGPTIVELGLNIERTTVSSIILMSLTWKLQI